ncbi:unnamed protein product [Moneuplotes crassus]|uniref:Uncharacterized protein n=1 Tax=Euplotes crassus TaxID=5936 RepID=A0AAD1UEN7_EUPCR|nr:unnamed protein product [Moneuplotes crassus]
MIVTWGKEAANQSESAIQGQNVSEELLDEHIETRFRKAKQYFEEAFENADEEKLQSSLTVFNELFANERLQACRTERHKTILFESSFHLAEIHQEKRSISQALKYYFKSVQIRGNHIESWTKMGDLFYSQDSVDKPHMKKKALDCYLKALEANESPDINNSLIQKSSGVGTISSAPYNKTMFFYIIQKLCDIYFLEGEHYKCRKMLEMYLKRHPNDTEYLLLQSFLHRLNSDDDKYLIAKVCKLKNNQPFDYFSVPIIKKFMMNIKPPQGLFDHKTRVFTRTPVPHQTNQTSTLIIKKLNIRGLNKFICDLDDLVSKICPYCEEFNKILEPKQIEFIKADIIKELKDNKLIIEFPNADLKDLASCVDTKVNKIYQVEFEKELTAVQTISVSNSTSKDVYSGLKKRSAKRRSNMHKSDSHQWETEALPNQRDAEIRNIFTNKMRKYLDRIKSEIAPISYNDLILTRDLNKSQHSQEHEDPNTTEENIKSRESLRSRGASNAEEEKKSSMETRPKKKRGPKPKKESVYSKIYESEENVHKLLVSLFEIINSMNGYNLYDFILNFLEFPLRNSYEAQKLIYTPNSLNFYNLFQKVYITLNDWEKSLPLESLVFLTEITCRNSDYYYGYFFIRDKLFDCIQFYNPKILQSQNFSESLQVRICYLLSKYFKDVTHQKIEAVELIEKAQKLLENIKKRVIQGTEEYEESEYESIVLPWVSFQECITQEKLISLWKDLEMEVDILFFVKPSLKSEENTLLEKLNQILKQKPSLVEEDLPVRKELDENNDPKAQIEFNSLELDNENPEELEKIKDQFAKIFSTLKKYNGELFKKTNRFRYLEIHSNGGLDKDITIYLAQGFPFEFFESAQIDPIEAKKKLQVWASGKNIDAIDDSDESDYSMNSDDDLSDQNKDESKLESSQDSELESNQESHPNKLEDSKEESNEESKEQSKEESMETSKEEPNNTVSNLDKDNDAKESKEQKDPVKATIESKEESSMELASRNPLNEEDEDEGESDSSSNEDEDSKDTSEELSQEVELKFTKIESERLLSLGLFFLKSMFTMIEDESGNVKDDQSFDSCLKYCRKIFKGVDFNGFAAMFRYLLIKMDILRVENSRTHTSIHNSDFYKKLNNKLVYIIKDGFNRCDFYYSQIKDWFDDKCITQEKLFMNFSEEAPIEAKVSLYKKRVIIYRQMINLLVNYINPQNLANIVTSGPLNGFNVVLGMLIRLQLIIAYMEWYIKLANSNDPTSKASKDPSLDEISRLQGFSDYLKMLHYIDHMCNQSTEIIGNSYPLFVDQYFSLNFPLIWYFMNNYPNLYPNMNTLLWRQMKQVYGIDMSGYDDSSSDKETPIKQESEKFWINQKETKEIERNLQSMDQISTVSPARSRIPDLFDLTKILKIIIKHPVYKIFKSEDYESIAKVLHKNSSLKSFLYRINKRISHCTLMLFQSNFFSKNKLHYDAMSIPQKALNEGIMTKVLGFNERCNTEIFERIENCFCMEDQNSFNCFSHDFHIFACEAFFIYLNTVFATTVTQSEEETKVYNSVSPSFPYIPSVPTRFENLQIEGAIKNDPMKTLEFLIEIDLFFNPCSYHSCQLSAYLRGYNFSKAVESGYTRGLKKIVNVKEELAFRQTIFSCAYGIYNSICHIIVNGGITEQEKKSFDFQIPRSEWFFRIDNLNRWFDSNPTKELTDLLLLLIRTIKFYMISRFEGKEYDIIATIEENKLRNLLILTCLCYLVIAGYSQLCKIEGRLKSATLIMGNSVGRYLMALHQDDWINYEVFGFPKTEQTIEDKELMEFRLKKSLKETEKHYTTLWKYLERLTVEDGFSWESMTPIPFIILSQSLSELEDGLTKYSFDLQFLHEVGKKVFQSCVVQKKGAKYKERYSVTVLSNLFVQECHSIAKIFNKHLDEYEFKSDLTVQEGFKTMNTCLTDAMIQEDILGPRDGTLINTIQTVKANLELIEIYLQKNNYENKPFVQAKVYQTFCKFALITKIPNYLEFCKARILSLYSKALINLENEICDFEFDHFYGSTLGSAIMTISDRMEMIETFCDICVTVGDYQLLDKFNKGFKSRCKEDTDKANQALSKTAGGLKIERKIQKMAAFSSIRALRTCVDLEYKEYMTPKKTSKSGPRRDPNQEHATKPRDLVGREKVPELLKDTFTIYQFYKNSPGGLAGKGKSILKNEEKELLFECVFKMRIIHEGMVNQNLLTITDKEVAIEALKDCEEWFASYNKTFKTIKLDQYNKENAKIF